MFDCPAVLFIPRAVVAFLVIDGKPRDGKVDDCSFAIFFGCPDLFSMGGYFFFFSGQTAITNRKPGLSVVTAGPREVRRETF